MKNKRIKQKIKEKFEKLAKTEDMSLEHFLVFCDKSYTCYRSGSIEEADNVYIDVKSLVVMLIDNGVETVYIAHNHCNDERLASDLDRESTLVLHGVLKHFGINLLGSYIYTSTGVWEVTGKF